MQAKTEQKNVHVIVIGSKSLHMQIEKCAIAKLKKIHKHWQFFVLSTLGKGDV